MSRETFANMLQRLDAEREALESTGELTEDDADEMARFVREMSEELEGAQ